MAELLERVKLGLLYYGSDIPSNFKNNSLFFYDKYQGSSKDVQSISVVDITPGRFYFLHYRDDSSWMQYSPVFIAGYKKFEDKVILFGVNFNFMPIEIRVMLFDKFIKEEDIENDRVLKVDYQGMYDELRRIGFEYTLMEFNVYQIVKVHKIHLEVLHRFLYSQHPKNIYDPNKLNQIWNAKIANREQRHKELMAATLNEFYDMNNEISDKYDTMKDHIKRLKKSIGKYGS